MGAFYEAIPENLIQWILEQKMFWVGTAPLVADTKANGGLGHVNISPKGGPYFGVLSPTQFWYMDLTGSGSETISHLHEPHNGRITILFSAFHGPPRILRLWGHGTVYENATPEFHSFIATHSITTIPGSRSIILVDIHQVGTSCGFSVPFYDFVGHRDVLNEFMRKKEERFKKGKEEESMPRYWAYKNAYSMDGLPGMKLGLSAGRELGVEPMGKMVGRLRPRNRRVYPGAGVAWWQLLLVLVLGVLIGVVGAVLAMRGGGEGGSVRWELKKLVEPVVEEVRMRLKGVGGAIALPSPAQMFGK